MLDGQCSMLHSQGVVLGSMLRHVICCVERLLGKNVEQYVVLSGELGSMLHSMSC